MAHPFPLQYASSADQPGLLSRRQQPAPYMHLELPPLSQLLTEKSKATGTSAAAGTAATSTSVPTGVPVPAAMTTSAAPSALKNAPLSQADPLTDPATAAATVAAVAAAAASTTVPGMVTTSQAFDHTQMSMYPTQPLYYGEMLPSTAGASDLFPTTMVMGGGTGGAVSDASFAPPAFSLNPAPMFTADTVAAAAVNGFMDQNERRTRQLSVSSNSSDKIYSFVAIPGTNHKKRPRRRYDEIERLYHCNWHGCSKAYGTLNHLNAHVSMQKHGAKRHPSEFKEMRKEWRRQKKERDAAKKASDDAARQHRQEQQQQQQQQQSQQQFQVMPPPPFQPFPMPLGGYY